MPRLQVSGAQIVRQDNGQPVILRGANMLRYEYHNNTSNETTLIPVLASQWGGNCVMLGFSTDLVNSNGLHPFSGTNYMGMIDEIVASAKANNVYIVLSVRSAAHNGAQFVGVPPQAAIDALAVLAARYKNENHVMFSSQVETNGSSNWPPTVDPTWAQAKVYYQACVDAVNTATAPHKTIVMTSSPGYGRWVNPAVADPIVGTTPSGVPRNQVVVYKTHPYGDLSLFQSWFGDAVDAGLPVFIGEFGPHGTDTNDGATMEQKDYEYLLGYADYHNLGWTAWMFDYQGAPALITSNTTGDPTVPYGQVVKDAMLGNPPPWTPPGGGYTPSRTLFTFDPSLQGWDSVGVAAHETAIKRTGAGSLKVTTTRPASGASNSITYAPDVIEDVTAYGDTFEAWVYLPPGQPGSGHAARIAIQYGSFQWSFGTSVLLVESQWTRVAHTFTDTAVLTTKRKFGISLDTGNNAPGGDVIYYVDDYSQGSVA